MIVQLRSPSGCCSFYAALTVKESEPSLLHLTLVHFYLVKSAIVHIAAMYC